jgi:hypothetical protein
MYLYIFILKWCDRSRCSFTKKEFNISYKRFCARVYTVLYNALSAYSWPSLSNETSVEAAIDRLNIDVTQATDIIAPSRPIKSHNLLTHVCQWIFKITPRRILEARVKI